MANTALDKKVRAALERDTDVNLHQSQIEVTAQGTIRLSGQAEDIATKRRALQIAREAAEGHVVEDYILLRPQQERTGDELRASVLNALMQETTFSGFAIRARGEGEPPGDEQDWIEVEIAPDQACVKLHGRVWSLSHRRLAEVLTWWVPGTADVDNRIRVQPAERDSDDEITDAVRLVFDKDPSLDVQQIYVKTEHAEVTLQGEVQSDEARRIASLDCWYIPGVHAVHNDLRVRPVGPAQR
jgi:osmotically-inducible protein OsmY